MVEFENGVNIIFCRITKKGVVFPEDLTGCNNFKEDKDNICIVCEQEMTEMDEDGYYCTNDDCPACGDNYNYRPIPKEWKHEDYVKKH